MSGLPATSTSGFGTRSVSGCHAGAEAGGEHHGVAGSVGLGGQTLILGTCARYHAFSGDSAGCASARCR